MVGHLGSDGKLEQIYSDFLHKYFIRDDTVFVFSTDFCHWGQRFNYQPFYEEGTKIFSLIEDLDRQGMEHIFNKKDKEFKNYLQKT